MIDLIVKKAMQNIAQDTTLFDLETTPVQATTQNNTMTIAGLNGEYVVSGGVDGAVASKGCVNQLLNFVDGVATTDCFFGADANIIDVVLHKVNVGSAIKRDLAVEMMLDDDIPNAIIVYWESTESTENKHDYSISNDLQTMMMQRVGVLAKVEATALNALGGCNVIDRLLISNVIKIDTDDATLVRFDSVKDRFFAGKNYCVDLSLSYLEYINLNDIIRGRLKHFNASSELNLI